MKVINQISTFFAKYVEIFFCFNNWKQEENKLIIENYLKIKINVGENRVRSILCKLKEIQLQRLPFVMTGWQSKSKAWCNPVFVVSVIVAVVPSREIPGTITHII
jgi:hypothetical protein